MLFRKRRPPAALLAKSPLDATGSLPEWEEIMVDYEMMTKGATLQRRGRKVRQFAVMVNGSVRVVTSGDTVDRAVFLALLAAGAVKAPWDGSGPSVIREEEPVNAPETAP